MRAVGTFCLAKKDVSRENKRRNEKERETCWQSRGGEERRVQGGVKAAYSGHQLGSRRDQTQHYRGDEEKQTHTTQPTRGSAITPQKSQIF